MNESELCLSLGTRPDNVREWLAQGMPSQAGQFDPDEVRRWLLSRGLLEVQTAETQAELAGMLGRSERVIASYLSRGMPGKTDHGYDVIAAREWISNNVQGRADGLAQEKARQVVGKLREERLTTRLKRLAMERRLVPLDDVLREFSMWVIRIKDRLEQMPDEMEMHFPTVTRHENKQYVQHYIDQVLREMAAWEFDDLKPQKKSKEPQE